MEVEVEAVFLLEICLVNSPRVLQYQLYKVLHIEEFIDQFQQRMPSQTEERLVEVVVIYKTSNSI